MKLSCKKNYKYKKMSFDEVIPLLNTMSLRHYDQHNLRLANSFARQASESQKWDRISDCAKHGLSVEDENMARSVKCAEDIGPYLSCDVFPTACNEICKTQKSAFIHNIQGINYFYLSSEYFIEEILKCHILSFVRGGLYFVSLTFLIFDNDIFKLFCNKYLKYFTHIKLAFNVQIDLESTIIFTNNCKKLKTLSFKTFTEQENIQYLINNIHSNISIIFIDGNFSDFKITSLQNLKNISLDLSNSEMNILDTVRVDMLSLELRITNTQDLNRKELTILYNTVKKIRWSSEFHLILNIFESFNDFIDIFVKPIILILDDFPNKDNVSFEILFPSSDFQEMNKIWEKIMIELDLNKHKIFATAPFF